MLSLQLKYMKAFICIFALKFLCIYPTKSLTCALAQANTSDCSKRDKKRRISPSQPTRCAEDHMSQGDISTLLYFYLSTLGTAYQATVHKN